VTEPSTLALLERGGQFAGASIPTSDLAHFRRASNKAEVLSVAKTLGLDVPDQWAVSSAPGLIPEIPLDQFPVVVKPSRSVVGPEGRRHKTEVSYAATPEQLQSLVATLVADSGPPLVQPRVEGPGVGIFMLRWGGEILASFAHRRIREKPPSGGVSVCCESVAPPPELLAQSAALLAALDWTGVAMIEYKLDTRSNRHYLMEVNPRFWGSLQLAIDAGVDFPWLLIQLALGRTIEPVHRWRIGLRSRWLFGELDHLIARLRHSPADLNLPRDAPGLFRTAAGTLSPCWPGERSDVFRLTDPVPAFREAIAWFRDL
jgi:predicted ATP-grasp superfamily ATP-dependent carboligase